jgi:hypothetical protein
MVIVVKANISLDRYVVSRIIYYHLLAFSVRKIIDIILQIELAEDEEQVDYDSGNNYIETAFSCNDYFSNTP